MIVVTGGAGFIGSAYIHYLNELNFDDIYVVDHLDEGSKWKNLVAARFKDYCDRSQFIELIDKDLLSKEISIIFHLGACSKTTEKDSAYLIENNTLYTKKLAQWCLKHNIKFIYASSAATYGDGSNGYDDNVSELDHLKPLNGYGFSKHLFDQWAYHKGWFDQITGFKFFNVFGPYEGHKGDMRSLVRKSFQNVENGHGIKLFKSYRDDFADGEQKRDFIYIRDVVRVLNWAGKNNHISGLFNLGRGQAVSWNHIAHCLFSACGQKEAIEYIEMPENLRDQYQYFTQAEMNKLRQAGYQDDFMEIDSAVEDYVSWLRKNPEL